MVCKVPSLLTPDSSCKRLIESGKVRALERIYNIVLGDSEHATLCGEGAEKELGCCYLGLSSVRQSSPNAAASEFLPSLSRRRTCFDIIPANTIKVSDT